jgi:hypothetical protein
MHSTSEGGSEERDATMMCDVLRILLDEKSVILARGVSPANKKEKRAFFAFASKNMETASIFYLVSRYFSIVLICRKGSSSERNGERTPIHGRFCF